MGTLRNTDTRPTDRIISLLEEREQAERATYSHHEKCSIHGTISTDTLPKFNHINAASLEEALSLLKTFGERARVKAGGTDVLQELKDRVWPAQPKLLINLKTISRPRKLDYIEESDEGLRIGSLVTIRRVESDARIVQRYGLLAQAAHAAGTPMVRNMATLGGDLCQHVRCWYYRASGNAYFCLRKGSDKCFALDGDNRYHAILGAGGCHAVCPSDTAIALVALDARVRIAGMRGERVVPLHEFYTPLGNVLEPVEIVNEIEIPAPKPGSRGIFLKLRSGHIHSSATACVSVVVTVDNSRCTDARLVLGSVSPVPWRAVAAEKVLVGQRITDDLVDEAAQLAITGAFPLSMNGYKVDAAKGLVMRALRELR